MSEIKYDVGIEWFEDKVYSTKEKREECKKWGYALQLGLLVSIGSFIALIITKDLWHILGIGIPSFFGIMYEYNGGSDLDIKGYNIKRYSRKYYDLLNTRTGKIRRLYIREKEQ